MSLDETLKQIRPLALSIEREALERWKSWRAVSPSFKEKFRRSLAENCCSFSPRTTASQRKA